MCKKWAQEPRLLQEQCPSPSSPDQNARDPPVWKAPPLQSSHESSLGGGHTLQPQGPLLLLPHEARACS